MLKPWIFNVDLECESPEILNSIRVCLWMRVDLRKDACTGRNSIEDVAVQDSVAQLLKVKGLERWLEVAADPLGQHVVRGHCTVLGFVARGASVGRSYEWLRERSQL